MDGLRQGGKIHWPLAVVVVIYLLAAVPHSLIVPLTAGNDEWAHFLYARFIREHGRLPVSLEERQDQEAVGTKSDDPPLYHILVALVSGGVDPARVLRPVNGDPYRQLADNMVVSYAFIVHTAYEQFPFEGEVWLWYAGRGVSILSGMVLILLTYVTSLTLFPRSAVRALLAAALLAFWPAFIFHTSVMTYDGLGAVLTALFLLAAIQAVKKVHQWRWWAIMGGLAGLAVTTKYTSVLLPVEIIVVAGLVWFLHSGSHGQRPSGWGILLRIGVAGLVMVVASSWWFGFVLWHFNTVGEHGWLVGLLEPLIVRGGNDTTAINVMAVLFGSESISVDLPAPARARDYPALARIMLDSFWAGRINEKYLLSPWLALLFGGLMLVSLAGLWRGWTRASRRARGWLVLLLIHTLLIVPLILARLFLSFDPVEAVQGRHLLFPAATAIPVLLMWGWRQMSAKLGQVMVVSLLWWSILGQLGWAWLVYPGPIPVWAETVGQPLSRLDSRVPMDEQLDNGLRLISADWPGPSGALSLPVELWWQLAETQREDVLVQVLLLDESGEPASTSVGHPVQGRYPTRSWETPDIVRDDHWLPLAGISPGPYRIALRLLRLNGEPISESVLLGELFIPETVSASDQCAIWVDGRPLRGSPLTQPLRLRQSFVVRSDEQPRLEPITDPELPIQMPFMSVQGFYIFLVGPAWDQRYNLMIGDVRCQSIAVDLPQRDFDPPVVAVPLEANFNNQIRLLGYELPTRRIAPGERLPLVLYWQGLDTMGEDYQQFDNLLDRNQQRRGGYDRRAKDGYSTVLWAPGEFITDRFGVPVAADAPPGIYTIDLGWYRKTEQGAVSLPVYVGGQPTDQSSVRLGPIKVGGPPPDVVISGATPHVELNQPFGENISLLGYDLLDDGGYPVEGSTASENLKFVFYWLANGRPAADYTTFLHLRNNNNETMAQKDQPPAAGRYPTSLWDTGEIIVDEVLLPISDVPSGRYTPVVGLYDLSTGQRLSTPGNPANELHLESVVLSP